MTLISMNIIDCYREAPSDAVISFTEQNLRVQFPESFLNCIRQCDEGRPEKSYFKLIDRETKNVRWTTVGAFLSFYPGNHDNILRNYFERPEFFPQTLIAFAETGDGDFICFDYSVSGWEDPDPPIVYWSHEKSPDKAVSDIAINFEEFLKILKACPEDEQ